MQTRNSFLCWRNGDNIVEKRKKINETMNSDRIEEKKSKRSIHAVFVYIKNGLLSGIERETDGCTLWAHNHFSQSSPLTKKSAKFEPSII